MNDKRNIKAVLLIFIIVAALFAIAAVYLNTSVIDGPRNFVVHEGEALPVIAANLEEAGLIRSALLFRLTSRISGTSRKMKIGTYELEKGMSMLAVHDVLKNGKQVYSKVTIKEGHTLSQIEAVLIDSQAIPPFSDFIRLCHDKEVLNKYGLGEAVSLEGFLYPDTYIFPQNYAPERIIDTMVHNFFKQIEAINPDYSEMSWQEFYDTVKVASIVQGEYKLKEEAPRIASVFWNRLRIWMHLQSCATVVYIKKEILGHDHPERLSDRDLVIDNEYNTYLNYGLPPGPISNPGRTALAAAFDPADEEYLFFLLKDQAKGEHYFSKSLEEHNRMKKLYIQ